MRLTSWLRTGALSCATGLALVLFVPTPVNAWGDAGHRIIGLVAATTLPSDMPSFFREAAPRLAYLNEDAGILGHFVADGSNPHHTTKHYNGWTGENPNGYTTDNRFHGRFESQYVQAHVREGDVRAALTAPAQAFPGIRPAVLSYLARTNQLVDTLYALDKVATFRPETTTPEQKAFAVSRMAAGAAMLRDLWYTAWVTSARGE